MRFGAALGRLLPAALIGLAACADADGERPNAADQRPVVELVVVAPAATPGAVRASGLVGYKREPDLSFNAPGVISAIRVDIGDPVRRGQTLATLRRTSVGANAGESALARENAERNLARTQDLFDRGFVSEARLESARLDVERARDVSVIVAPADGVILRRRAEPSQSVNAGTPVFSLGETGSGLIVRASLASAPAARVRTGAPAVVRVPELDGQSRRGAVTRIAAKGDDVTGAFEVEVLIDAPAGLRSGMVAAVEIDTGAVGAAPQALVVPALALLDARADQGIVYVVDADGVARRRAVRTAGVIDEGVRVIEGLAPGERVVAAGAPYVRNGEPVRIAAPTS